MRPGDRSYDVISELQDRLPLLEPIPMMILWGHEGFRLRFTDPRRMGPQVPQRGGAPVRPGRPLIFEDEARGDHAPDPVVPLDTPVALDPGAVG